MLARSRDSHCSCVDRSLCGLCLLEATHSAKFRSFVHILYCISANLLIQRCGRAAEVRAGEERKGVERRGKERGDGQVKTNTGPSEPSPNRKTHAYE